MFVNSFPSLPKVRQAHRNYNVINFFYSTTNSQGLCHDKKYDMMSDLFLLK
jgi:hypothetical protein